MVTLLAEANTAKIEATGGQEAQDQLPQEEKDKINAESYNWLQQDLGEEAFNALLEEEKREVNFLVWSGCCMHEEINATKGGNVEMQAH